MPSICVFSSYQFHRFVIAAVVAAIALSSLNTVAARASTKAARNAAADELVGEALHREIYGATGERSQLLEAAKRESPDHPAAMWHSGHVKVRGKWVKVADVPQQTNDDPRIQRYEQKRLLADDTVAGHLALADYCHKLRLADRERAHLTRVVELAPDHAAARARLGFQRVSGRWVDVAQSERAADEANENGEAFRLWSRRLATVRRSFKGGRLQQEAGAQKLMEIRDPAAVPAIEAHLVSLNEPAALASIKALEAMDAYQADLTIARVAVFCQWSDVRRAAAEALRLRPLENYVPDLLAAMHSEVRSTWQLYEGRGNRLMMRHTFVREGQDETEQLVLETGYRRIALPGGDGAETWSRALNNIAVTGQARVGAQAWQNLSQQQLNDRIMAVLEFVTNEQRLPQPQDWWAWWDKYNEVFRPAQKPVDTNYQYREVTLVDRSISVNPETGGGGGGGSQTCDCLAAGTKVWTDTGPRPIEEIRVGDLVLSQDPETGELAYKPVLRFTIRPASQLTTLTAGDEKITCSGGHLFWVAGDGWTRAREARPGAELHSFDRSVQLSAKETAGFEPTYNVIVEDFHNYFVGERRPVLCHDNTSRRRTDAVVPGLLDR